MVLGVDQSACAWRLEWQSSFYFPRRLERRQKNELIVVIPGRKRDFRFMQFLSRGTVVRLTV